MVIMHVMMKDVNHVLVVWVVLDHHVIFIQVNVNVNLVLVEGKHRYDCVGNVDVYFFFLLIYLENVMFVCQVIGI
jgi:hypothetical protein